ncbi:unnamed protein product, partial [Medioppia subpectinata]
MKSTESGLIAGGYDVGAFLLLAPISYFGGTRSKPLFISAGILVMASVLWSSLCLISHPEDMSSAKKLI